MDKKELIAEFMGYLNERWWHFNKHEFEPDVSWDSLMPVVEKIEAGVYGEQNTTFNVLIFSDSCHIESNFPKLHFECDGSNKIDATYNTVIAFIQWYNNTPSLHTGGGKK